MHHKTPNYVYKSTLEKPMLPQCYGIKINVITPSLPNGQNHKQSTYLLIS